MTVVLCYSLNYQVQPFSSSAQHQDQFQFKSFIFPTLRVAPTRKTVPILLWDKGLNMSNAKVTYWHSQNICSELTPLCWKQPYFSFKSREELRLRRIQLSTRLSLGCSSVQYWSWRPSSEPSLAPAVAQFPCLYEVTIHRQGAGEHLNILTQLSLASR